MEHVVDQAVVALEHERPGDDGRVDRQGVRDEEDRPQEAPPAAEVLLQHDRRRDPEQPRQADGEEREDAGDEERVEQCLADRGGVDVDGDLVVVEATPGRPAPSC